MYHVIVKIDIGNGRSLFCLARFAVLRMYSVLIVLILAFRYRSGRDNIRDRPKFVGHPWPAEKVRRPLVQRMYDFFVLLFDGI